MTWMKLDPAACLRAANPRVFYPIVVPWMSITTVSCAALAVHHRLAVPGRVLITSLKSVGSSRKRVALKSSTYSTGVVVESRRVATAWSKPIM